MTTLFKNTLFAAILCAGFIYSCTCTRVDCRISELKSIRFFTVTDSSDFIVGNGIVLDSSLTITPLFIGTSVPSPEISIEQFTNFQYAINIGINQNIRGFEFRIDSLPPDTLLVEVGIIPESQCCPSFPIFDKITLNGVELPNSLDDTIFIPK